MASQLGTVSVEYFDLGNGRSGPIKILLSYAGVPFNEDNISQADFAAVKHDSQKYPNGGLPMVVINGERMG